MGKGEAELKLVGKSVDEQGRELDAVGNAVNGLRSQVHATIQIP